MTNVPGESPGNSPKPIKPPTHKRGAFPTPKSEIEKAKPYIPDLSEEEDFPEENPDRPTDIEREKESDPGQGPFDPSEEVVNSKSM